MVFNRIENTNKYMYIDVCARDEIANSHWKRMPHGKAYRHMSIYEYEEQDKRTKNNLDTNLWHDQSKMANQ